MIFIDGTSYLLVCKIFIIVSNFNATVIQLEPKFYFLLQARTQIGPVHLLFVSVICAVFVESVWADIDFTRNCNVTEYVNTIIRQL